MADRQITDSKTLLSEVSALGAAMRERRRHDRRSLLWTATIEVRGEWFEGTIVDLSPGGARLRFDAPVSQGDELNLLLKELDGLGGRVVWQRQGEAGIQFMLAPEEITTRLEREMGLDLRRPARSAEIVPPRAPTAEPPSATSRAGKRSRLMAIAGAGLVVVIGMGAVLARGSGEDGVKEVFAITGGAVGQHDCSSRLDKLAGSTNQIDFSLNVASAVHSKCLDLKQITGGETDPRGHMVQATKVRPH